MTYYIILKTKKNHSKMYDGIQIYWNKFKHKRNFEIKQSQAFLAILIDQKFF